MRRKITTDEARGKESPATLKRIKSIKKRGYYGIRGLVKVEEMRTIFRYLRDVTQNTGRNRAPVTISIEDNIGYARLAARRRQDAKITRESV